MLICGGLPVVGVVALTTPAGDEGRVLLQLSGGHPVHHLSPLGIVRALLANLLRSPDSANRLAATPPPG